MHLLTGEKPEHGPLEALHGYGQDLLSELQGRRALQGHEMGKGTHCGQSRIAAAHRVVAFGFEVGKEVEDQRRVEITQRQLGRRLAPLSFDIGQQ